MRAYPVKILGGDAGKYLNMQTDARKMGSTQSSPTRHLIADRPSVGYTGYAVVFAPSRDVRDCHPRSKPNCPRVHQGRKAHSTRSNLEILLSQCLPGQIGISLGRNELQKPLPLYVPASLIPVPATV